MIPRRLDLQEDSPCVLASIQRCSVHPRNPMRSSTGRFSARSSMRMKWVLMSTPPLTIISPRSSASRPTPWPSSAPSRNRLAAFAFVRLCTSYHRKTRWNWPGRSPSPTSSPSPIVSDFFTEVDSACSSTPQIIEPHEQRVQAVARTNPSNQHQASSRDCLTDSITCCCSVSVCAQRETISKAVPPCSLSALACTHQKAVASGLRP